MTNHNQDGAGNLALLLVVTVILLILSLVFGGWAFSSREDYKNNTDAKIKDAVNQAIAQESQIKDQQFAVEEQNPLTTYNGPEAYGSMVINYPKNWSAYVDTTGAAGPQVAGYFSPGAVPSIASQNSVFALQVQVLNQTYSETLQSISGQQQNGGINIQAYSLPKLPKVIGVEVEGNLGSANQANVTMVVLPLRSDTLEIWTDGTQYLDEFNNDILPNFSFSP